MKKVYSIAAKPDIWDELGMKGFNRSEVFDIGAHYVLGRERTKKRRGGN